MPDQADSQPRLPFASDGAGQGYERWQEQRREAMQQLARQLNLPLGHRAEVWLRGGIVLRGTLRLREELLFVEQQPDYNLQLLVDGVPFAVSEIESCVRLD